MRVFGIMLACCLFIAACSNKPSPPDTLLPEKTYVNLLVELQMLQPYAQLQQTDSLQIDSLRGAIFKKYGATQRQFQESHKYYQQNMDQQIERIKQAIENLRKDHIANQDSTVKDSSAKDSTARKDSLRQIP